MWPRFEEALTQYRELEQQLADPAVIADRAASRASPRSTAALAKLVKPYLEFKKLAEEIATAEALAAAESDPEMRQYAEDELNRLRRSARRCRRGWKTCCWSSRARTSAASSWKSGPAPAATRPPCSPATSTTCTRTTPATWAGRSRTSPSAPASRAASRKSSSASPATTFSTTCATRAAAIACSACPRPSSRAASTPRPPPWPSCRSRTRCRSRSSAQDIEWERIARGGAGGQHVNKTESAVRIWYKRGTADEMEVKCQDERSQHKNYDRAMRILRSRLYERSSRSCTASAPRAQDADRLRRPQRAHPHLQLPAEPPHRPPHQPDPLQARRHHRRQPRRSDPGAEGLRQEAAPRADAGKPAAARRGS